MDPEGQTEAYDDVQHEITTEKPLSRVASRRSATSSLGPPPDGGLLAWTQVLMAHLTFFNTWGYINSFGVFQTYYVTALHHSRSDISWIGSVQLFLLFGIGTFSGRALDAGLYRVVFGAGIILQLIGIFMTSLSTKYWQVFLAQGVCTGIGDGLTFCPTLALVSTYFSKNKSLAIALVACGTSTGGLVFPAMVRQLLPLIGFPWTVRALGFVQLGLNALAFTFLRTRIPPRTSGPLVEWAAFKDATYSLFIAGMFFAFWTIYFVFFYAGSFAVDTVGFSYTDSINLIFILNGIGIVSRIVPGWLADKYTGPLNLLIPLSFFSGIMLYGWVGVSNEAGVYAWTVFYALISNGIQGLWPAALSSLTADLRKAGTRMGMGFSVISIACLTGAPLAGALIQNDHGSYLYAQIWGGSSLVLGAIIMCGARWASTGWKLKSRI